MQYTVLVNQLKAVEWQLNPAQAALMAFVYELEAWGDDVVKDDFAYKWISKQKVIDELPLFFSKPDTVHRNLISLEEKGLIVRNFTSKISLVKITPLGREWRIKVGNKSELRSDLNPIKVGNKSELRSDLNPTDPSTSILVPNPSYSLCDSSNSEELDSSNIYEEAFSHFCSAGLRRIGLPAARKEFLKALEKSNFEPMVFAQMLFDDIRKRLAFNQFGFDKLHPETYLKKERWRDEIVNDQVSPASQQVSELNTIASRANEIAKLYGEIGDIQLELEKRKTLDPRIHAPYIISMEKKLIELNNKKDQLINQD
ncbi:hypothetical protein [Vibrio diazotrophicus]|uniref:hypothetical protein n=1 Tax=Vibrio diazotrophicus TaxID=685 RepID=UPI003D2F799F